MLMPKKKIYTAADIARAMSTVDDPWDAQRARRWLKATGAGVKRGQGRGHWITTRERLREAFPELWAQIVAAQVETRAGSGHR